MAPKEVPEPKGIAKVKQLTQDLLASLAAANAVQSPPASPQLPPSEEKSKKNTERVEPASKEETTDKNADNVADSEVQEQQAESSSPTDAADDDQKVDEAKEDEPTSPADSTVVEKQESTTSVNDASRTASAIIEAQKSIAMATELGSSNVFVHNDESSQVRLGGSAATEIYKKFRAILVFSESKTETMNMITFPGSEDIIHSLFEAAAPFLVTDINIALYCCSIISNMCVFPDVRDVLDVSMLANVATVSISGHADQKKLVHLALMTLSNVSLSGRVLLTDHQCTIVAAAIAPLYQEARVVEAWASALCNLCGCAPRPSLIDNLVSKGTVITLERLLIFHGDDARLVHRGLQALGHLCSNHIEIPSALEM